MRTITPIDDPVEIHSQCEACLVEIGYLNGDESDIIVQVTQISDPSIYGEFRFRHIFPARSARKRCVDSVLGLGRVRTEKSKPHAKHGPNVTRKNRRYREQRGWLPFGSRAPVKRYKPFSSM